MVLNRRDAMLPDALAATVQSLTPAFEIAVPIRTKVMHGRRLGGTDEEQFESSGGHMGEQSPAIAGCQEAVPAAASLGSRPGGS